MFTWKMHLLLFQRILVRCFNETSNWMLIIPLVMVNQSLPNPFSFMIDVGLVPRFCGSQKYRQTTMSYSGEMLSFISLSILLKILAFMFHSWPIQDLRKQLNHISVKVSPKGQVKIKLKNTYMDRLIDSIFPTTLLFSIKIMLLTHCPVVRWRRGQTLWF